MFSGPLDVANLLLFFNVNFSAITITYDATPFTSDVKIFALVMMMIQNH